jgi:hypothetical protein
MPEQLSFDFIDMWEYVSNHTPLRQAWLEARRGLWESEWSRPDEEEVLKPAVLN